MPNFTMMMVAGGRPLRSTCWNGKWGYRREDPDGGSPTSDLTTLSMPQSGTKVTLVISLSNLLFQSVSTYPRIHRPNLPPSLTMHIHQCAADGIRDLARHGLHEKRLIDCRLITVPVGLRNGHTSFGPPAKACTGIRGARLIAIPKAASRGHRSNITIAV